LSARVEPADALGTASEKAWGLVIVDFLIEEKLLRSSDHRGSVAVGLEVVLDPVVAGRSRYV
jgi:hypothetical protein